MINVHSVPCVIHARFTLLPKENNTMEPRVQRRTARFPGSAEVTATPAVQYHITRKGTIARTHTHANWYRTKTNISSTQQSGYHT